ncbi:DNA-binding response regulator, NarL/FixJ family, contains REC and HTH domains [Paenibacillus sp. RU4T]|uniref:response regulator n=1 Tax=unclassified Paenibacillus TaxID=185978 RepID=UPI0009572E4B|nr:MULTISPECIES: response regulator transcription factor [unclassified Paenibacillus]SIQ76293.1 DNA-binding response regulator, NarL/FixJ family, contains REC and HTH domains [Paenibacillus sp. RU4X]SIQ97726.1 DNA-binding response regulator, NarL/FixJ family, contains REC and HTH domains [Paenibacillus sp. RU4T]
MSIRVLVVDPYQLVRRGLTSILSGEELIEVIGEASDRKEALAHIQNLQPDLCIMNNRINQQSGLDVISKLKQAGASCRFMYLTSSMRPAELQQALDLGIEGLVLKEALPEELIHSVRMIHRGRKYYDVELLESRLTDKPAENSHNLTPKELEVLQMLSEGLSNKEIASRLVVTEYTVKKHVSQVLSKLELTDRTKAALFYHQNSMFQNIV